MGLKGDNFALKSQTSSTKIPQPMSPRSHHRHLGALNVFTQIIRSIGLNYLSALNVFTQIIRSIGLNIFNLILNRVRGQNEKKKTVVSTSFWIAFSRCWVHFLPVSISIFLIQFNLRGYYFGKHLRGSTSNDRADSIILAVIQVAAKILVCTRRTLEGSSG